MATVTFAYNHSRDPMNPDDLGNKIAEALALTTLPTVNINPTQIIVTHPNVTSGNTSAIQAVINVYVLDPIWTNGPQGALLAKAQSAIKTNIDAIALPDPTAANNTYLAIGSPSAAQVAAQVRALTQQSTAIVAQLRAITRQNTTVIRVLVGALDSTDGT